MVAQGLWRFDNLCRNKVDFKVNIVEILAGVISGILGGMGLGGGGTLILYLTIFLGVEQLRASGINLIFFIPSALVALLIYIRRGAIKIKPLLPFIFGGVLGAILGIYLSSFLGSQFVGKLFGGALTVMGVREVFYKER